MGTIRGMCLFEGGRLFKEIWYLCYFFTRHQSSVIGSPSVYLTLRLHSIHQHNMRVELNEWVGIFLETISKEGYIEVGWGNLDILVIR